MRLALVATPAALPDLRPAPGSLDGDVIRARLPLPDAAFRVVDLDPAVDVAEQLERIFEADSSTEPILFYASCRVILSEEGEIFLSFDPAQPETGDSLRDITLVFRERARGPVAFILECRHAPDPDDPFRSAAVVAAAKEAVGAAGGAVELLVAAHLLADGEVEDRTSPLTRALIEALDDPESQYGLTLGQFFGAVRESPELIGAVACFAHVRGRSVFELLLHVDRPPPRAVSEPLLPPSVAVFDEGLALLSPRPPFRSESISIDLSEVDAEPEAPSEPPPPSASEPPKRAAGAPLRPMASADHVAVGDALKGAGDLEAALTSYKRALGMLGGVGGTARAEIHVRLGQVKRAQDKRREAIASFEKALALFPTLDGGLTPVPETQRATMEALIDLNVAERDARGVASAEERLLATLTDHDERFWRLVEFGTRWQDDAADPDRARTAFERARALKPDDTTVLERLTHLYQAAGMTAEALLAGQRLAALTRDPRERAERYFALGKQCIGELRKDDLGLDLFDLALESDPTMLEPLALVAKVLADRQEWSQLEQAYRRMLERVDQIPEGPVRTEVTFELCRRLGLLFRDHLEDPALGLDAFEDAVHAKPTDLPMLLVTAELSRSLGKHDRAALYLAEAAALEPGRGATYHDLFEAFQKLRRPDQAYQAACVTMLLRQADARERFIFEEHKPEGVPKPTYAMPSEGWGWLRRHDRDAHVAQAGAVLAAVTPAAIAVRLAQLAADGRLPALDPTLRQDPERSTVSIVRSFSWASHFLGVPAPAIYLNDDPDLALGAILAEEPTVIAGSKALRGRSLAELAFLVGRHLAYHVGGHRLLLYFPSMEDLTACFLAAIRIVLPEVPAPPAMRAAVAELERGIAQRISEANRVDLAAAVAQFEASGSRVHLADWAGEVERCATRAGFLLSGDLEVAAALLRAEPRAALDPEAKVADLLAFAVSEEHHALRESLGIAIQP